MIKYKKIVQKREDIEEEAKSLLLQMIENKDTINFVTISSEGEAVPSCIYYLRPDQKSEGDIIPEGAPVVYFTKFANHYRLYMVFDKSRLPFCWRVDSLSPILPLCSPTVKPLEALPIDTINNPERTLALEEYIGGEADTKSTFTGEILNRRFWETVKEMKDTPKKDRLALFFDMDWIEEGEEEPDTEYISKEELAKLAISGKWGKDLVPLANALELSYFTGLDVSTEEKYLESVETFIGRKLTKKIKTALASSYRFDKTIRAGEYLYYELLRTEDYQKVLKAEEALIEYAGYKREYPLEFEKKAEGVTASLIALCAYLRPVLNFPDFIDGLTLSRVCQYLGVDKETERKIKYYYEDIELADYF